MCDIWKGCFVLREGYMQIEEGHSWLLGGGNIWAESWKVWKHKLEGKREEILEKTDMFRELLVTATTGVCKENNRRQEGERDKRKPWMCKRHVWQHRSHLSQPETNMWLFPYFLSGQTQKHVTSNISAPACKWLRISDSLDVRRIIFMSKNPLLGENSQPKGYS